MTSGISFSGSGSGLPVQDWIDALVATQRTPVDNLYTKKQTYNDSLSALNVVESKFSSLKSSVTKLTDANLATSFDLFNARTATSSDTSVATVSASNTATVQNVSLKVESLATATKAASTAAVSKTMSGSELFTSIADKQGVVGTFGIYVNGSKNSLTIESTDTIENIVKKINDKFDAESDGDYTDNAVTASIVDGKLKITYDKSQVNTLTLGSSSDTSNFFNIMQLSTAAPVDNGDGTASFSSYAPINTINLTGKIIGNTANLNVSDADPITAGTFTIGKKEFTITKDTTLSDLISKINREADSGVTASYNSKENKIILTSKTAGKTAINLENGTSNFLTKVGLVSSSGDSLASQTLGNNAKVYINGATNALEVNSNTIKGDVSGITGLTINLKQVTKDDQVVNIGIDQDTDKLSSALTDFIGSFNAMVSTVNAQTAKGQTLHGEYTLLNLKNSFRSMVTDRVSGIDYFNNLSQIGISTGAAGKSVSDTSSTLVLDKDKLLAALEKDPQGVKELLVGNAATGVTGIMQKLQRKINSVTDPVDGYFTSKEDSINTLIANTDKSITRGEERITAYKTLITNQFNQMDQYIAKMQQQSSSISSIGS